MDRPIQVYTAKLHRLNRRTLLGVLFLAAVAWSVLQAGVFQQDLINGGGWTLVQSFLRAGLQPDLSPEILSVAGRATLATLAFAVSGTLLSLLIGCIGGILASEVWWEAVLPPRRERPLRRMGRPLPRLGFRAGLAVPRGIHEIIWGLFFVNIFGLDPLVAILAIGIPFGAMTAKVFSEILDEMPRRSLNALLNSGVPPLRAFIYALIPQAIPDLLSYAFYRFECSIRAAAVLGIIGAGGLGYQIFLSLQSLRYSQMWTFFFGLFLLSGLVDSWSGLLRRRLGAMALLEGSASEEDYIPDGGSKNARDPVILLSLLGAVLLLVFSLLYVKAGIDKLMAPHTAQLLSDIIREAWPPDLNHTLLAKLVDLSGQTLALSILAMVPAVLGGILLSLPAARNFMLPGGILNSANGAKIPRITRVAILLITRGLLLVFRAIPAPIWALIFLFVFFPGILPGAIALGLYTLGVLGRLMAEVIENLDERPLRALRAQGASGAQILAYGILPGSLPRFLAYWFYRWEVTIRATVLVGLVGAGGLGRLLTEQLSSLDYRGVLSTLIFLVGLTFLVDLAGGLARHTWR